MKSLFLTALICLPLFCYGQITFQEIESPNDFNLSAIRKSPMGEYFVQADNDLGSIYQSPDGENWTNLPLPKAISMDDIQFFSDGTPVLKPERNEHLIRRNGTWHLMDIASWFGNIEASFIKRRHLVCL